MNPEIKKIFVYFAAFLFLIIGILILIYSFIAFRFYSQLSKEAVKKDTSETNIEERVQCFYLNKLDESFFDVSIGGWCLNTEFLKDNFLNEITFYEKDTRELLDGVENFLKTTKSLKSEDLQYNLGLIQKYETKLGEYNKLKQETKESLVKLNKEDLVNKYSTLLASRKEKIDAIKADTDRFRNSITERTKQETTSLKFIQSVVTLMWVILGLSFLLTAFAIFKGKSWLVLAIVVTIILVIVIPIINIFLPFFFAWY